MFYNFSAVETSYDGPRLDDGSMTEEFVMEMIDRFKEQKTIHKKYAYWVWNKYLLLRTRF